MGYKKLIQSGNLVETYEYKQDYIERRIKSRTRAVRCVRTSVRNRRADNLRRLTTKFARLVRANLVGSNPPLFCTFTMLEVVPVGNAYRLLSRCIQRLRIRYGKAFRYVAVPEYQKRGAVHFHLLIWGLGVTVENERQERNIQRAWRYGYVDCVQTDGHVKLARYLAKYMQKTMSDERLISQKAYVASRNVLRPVCTTFSSAFYYLNEIIGDTIPQKVKQFKTQWLGECKYSQYVIHREGIDTN